MNLPGFNLFRSRNKKPVVTPVVAPAPAVDTSKWKVFEHEQPSDDVAAESVFVAYCFNGFITVCRWDSIEQVFKNMTGTRVINFVAKWLPLPDTKNYIN